MKKIKIERTKNATTQTSDSSVKQIDLLRDTRKHQKNVYDIICAFNEKMTDIALEHDHTKIENIDEFYRDFKDTIDNNKSFGDMKFYKKHYTEERHHLKSRVPDDVNLFDVLEMLADGVAAGLSRSGSVYDMEVDSDVLKKAISNTQKWMIEQCEIIDENN